MNTRSRPVATSSGEEGRDGLGDRAPWLDEHCNSVAAVVLGGEFADGCLLHY